MIHFRQFSIFAASAVLTLLGCSSERAPATSSAPTANTDGDAMSSNGAGHGDAVDSPDDVSWIAGQQASGASPLRVLMTDAPIDADNVFVTFCGIYVERGASMSSDAGRVEKANGAAGRAARPEGFARTDAGRDERDTRLTRDAGSASDAGAASAARGKALASREGWLTISEACQTVDLLTLQGGITEALGIASLPHGQYGQIRLMLVDASLVIAGETHELVVPSGAEGGLKIGGGFTLGEGAATTITLDFDAAESIHHAAGRGYMMAPVIKIVAVKVHAKTVDDAGARLAE